MRTLSPATSGNEALPWQQRFPRALGQGTAGRSTPATAVRCWTDEITLASLLDTMLTGFGDTLASLAILVVFGAVIGKLMVDSGAASQIAQTLIAKLGVRWVKVSLVICGLVFGLAMFYEVAFIVLAPLIIAVAHEARMPFMKLAIPRGRPPPPQPIRCSSRSPARWPWWMPTTPIPG